MGITYLLIFIVLFHIYLFRKIIFNWNVCGVFFISNLIFSLSGILLFPFIQNYVKKVFWTFNLTLITSSQIIETQILAVVGILIIMYAYILVTGMRFRKIRGINHFKIQDNIQDNISKSKYYFILFFIVLFLLVYLTFKRHTLIVGLFDGLIGRNPEQLLLSRRSITSNYLYVIITYNLLPFLTVISLYLSISKKSPLNKFIFFTLTTTSVFLILLLFQKRPLILFLMTFIMAGIVFRNNIKKAKIKSIKTKKQIRKKVIIYGSLLFSLLMILYYSGTNYKFDNILEGVLKLTEVSLTRVFGRLSMPSFLYVHYFPEIEGHYGLRNIGMLSKIFGYEIYGDTKVLFNHFSYGNKDGNMAIGSIFDFYGGFGYYGIVIGCTVLGVFIGVLDLALDRLEKNAINIIFIIFCFVFGYYLSQASFARSIMGYGFFFFLIIWLWLQKDFKIKLR